MNLDIAEEILPIRDDIPWVRLVRELMDDKHLDNFSPNCASAFMYGIGIEHGMDIINEKIDEYSILFLVYKYDLTTIHVRAFGQKDYLQDNPSVSLSSLAKQMRQVIENVSRNYGAWEHRDWTKSG